VSLYADDAAEAEPSRAALQTSFNDVVNTLARFGLKVHLAATPNDTSKTECMVFLPPHIDYNTVDTSPLHVDRGYATFCRQFRYLGSLVSDDGRDDLAVDDRIAKASAVFGALRKELFGNRSINDEVKSQVWEALVGAVLLFGSECWSLTAKQRKKIIRFQRRCVRTMCGKTRWQTWKSRTSASQLAQRIKMTSVETMYARKALAWLGHVVRMPYTRLCRQMAFAWMEQARRRGRPLLTWGHTMMSKNGLVRRAIGVSEPTWRTELDTEDPEAWKKRVVTLAKNREEWKAFVNQVTFEA
jgi:hypothetical protein